MKRAATAVDAAELRAADPGSHAVSAAETCDFDALSAAQQRVAGCVALNQDLGHSPRVLARLVELGVLESYEEPRGGHPPLTVTRYRMPLWAHLAWCEWCSKQAGS